MSKRLCDYSDCVEQCLRKQKFCKYHIVLYEDLICCSITYCTHPAFYKFKQYYYCYRHRTPFSKTIARYTCRKINCNRQEKQFAFDERMLCKRHRGE